MRSYRNGRERQTFVVFEREGLLFVCRERVARLVGERDALAVSFWSRIGQNFEILIFVRIFGVERRLGEFFFKFRGPFYERFALNDIAHRFFVGDPRAARLAPAGRIEDTHFDAFFRRRFERGVNDFPPFVGEEPDRTGRDIVLPDVADIGAVDSDGLHGANVFRDAFARRVAREPVPVCAGAHLADRIDEIGEHGRAIRIGRKLVCLGRHLMRES